MTLATGFAIACFLYSILHIIPVLGMGVDAQACPCTVAGQAGITIRVTALTGDQILAGLTGMTLRPLVGWQD